MPKPLNVPWDKIREAVEKGTSQTDVAKLFGISKDSIRMRSQRENWNTPKRLQQKLNKEAEEHNNRVARVHNAKVARNASLLDQLTEAEGGQISTATSAVVDYEQLTKDYRGKSATKLAKILDSTIIAPPRTWKDYDIADKMMRRLLGIDDNEGKSNTIVSLQLVNDRLMASSQDVVIEGDFIEESVPEVSQNAGEQRRLTDLEPASPLTATPSPCGEEAECQS